MRLISATAAGYRTACSGFQLAGRERPDRIAYWLAEQKAAEAAELTEAAAAQLPQINLPALLDQVTDEARADRSYCEGRPAGSAPMDRIAYPTLSARRAL